MWLWEPGRSPGDPDISLVDRRSFLLGDGLVGRHQLPGYGTGLAVPDDPAVDLADRADLRRGPRDEDLVGRIEVEVAEVSLDDREPHRRRDLQRDQAGDTAQVVQGRRGDEFPVLDDEDVVPRPLGDVALGVEEDSLIHAHVVRLDLREDVV